MSDEFDTPSENNFSSFWPLLILCVGLIIWVGIQDYSLNNQRSFYKKSIDDSQALLSGAVNWKDKYNALIKDLNDTGAKNPNAQAIFKDAAQAGIQAGLIRVQQGANGATGANGASAPAAPATPSK